MPGSPISSTRRLPAPGTTTTSIAFRGRLSFDFYRTSSRSGSERSFSELLRCFWLRKALCRADPPGSSVPPRPRTGAPMRARRTELKIAIRTVRVTNDLDGQDAKVSFFIARDLEKRKAGTWANVFRLFGGDVCARALLSFRSHGFCGACHASLQWAPKPLRRAGLSYRSV